MPATNKITESKRQQQLRYMQANSTFYTKVEKKNNSNSKNMKKKRITKEPVNQFITITGIQKKIKRL